MPDTLLHRWRVPPVVMRCVHWTMQRGYCRPGLPLTTLPSQWIFPETPSSNTVAWSRIECKQRHSWYFCCSIVWGWCIQRDPTPISHLPNSDLTGCPWISFRILVIIPRYGGYCVWNVWFFIFILPMQWSYGCLDMMQSVMPNMCCTTK